MPELPEVEVSRLGIRPHLLGEQVTRVKVNHPQLRWPVPEQVHQLQGQTISDVRRRAKYLLIDSAVGSLILHLGMSGRLRIVPISSPIQKHDHIELELTSGQVLRFNDARRFGACLWQATDAEPLSLLEQLGPEPLTDEFDADHLTRCAQKRTVAIKNLIMDNKVVVGVGNIYASEALFMAGVLPTRPAHSLSKDEHQRLVTTIKQVLARAIEQGGTTLKDFTQADGKPGYFAQQLQVYGRKGEGCRSCGSEVQSLVIGQRNSFFCQRCQH